MRDARALRRDHPRDRRRGRSVRARRHLRDPALVVAALRRAGLVRPPARLQLPGALEPARELRLQHRQRASAAAARLDLPLAARDARTCSSSRCCLRPPGCCGCGRGSALWLPTTVAPLRRAALDALALLLSRARARARRVRARAAAVAARAPGRRGRSSVVVGFALREGLPAHRARDDVTRRPSCASSSARAHAARVAAVDANGVEDASTSSHIAEPARRASRRSSIIRRASGPATRARPRRAPEVTIEAGESTYTRARRRHRARGRAALRRLVARAALGACARCTAWLGAAIVAMLALGLQTDIIGVPWLVYVLWTLAGWRVSHPDT